MFFLCITLSDVSVLKTCSFWVDWWKFTWLLSACSIKARLSIYICLCHAEKCTEDQVLSVDESVFQPPSQLQMPLDDIPASASDSAVSAPDSDDNSSDNSDLPSPGPRYADEEPPLDMTNNLDSRTADTLKPERNLVWICIILYLRLRHSFVVKTSTVDLWNKKYCFNYVSASGVVCYESQTRFC